MHTMLYIETEFGGCLSVCLSPRNASPENLCDRYRRNVVMRDPHLVVGEI